MRLAGRGAHRQFSRSKTIHNLEYLLLRLSDRIRHETGNDDLANAASQFASTSHDYEPPLEYESLSEMREDWARRFDKTPEQNTGGESPSPKRKEPEPPHVQDAAQPSQLRQELMRQLSREIPQETERDAEIERDRGRQRDRG